MRRCKLHTQQSTVPTVHEALGKEWSNNGLILPLNRLNVYSAQSTAVLCKLRSITDSMTSSPREGPTHQAHADSIYEIGSVKSPIGQAPSYMTLPDSNVVILRGHACVCCVRACINCDSQSLELICSTTCSVESPGSLVRFCSVCFYWNPFIVFVCFLTSGSWFGMPEQCCLPRCLGYDIVE